MSWKNLDWVLKATDMSDDDFAKKWAALIEKSFAGKLKATDIMGLYNRDKDVHDSENRLREMWKYGASIGVSGTPSAFVNGVKLDSVPATIEDWEALFKPMFPTKEDVEKDFL